jgi:hypothetical protein
LISSPVAVATIRISTAGVTLAAAGVIEGRANNAEGRRGGTSQLGAEVWRQGGMAGRSQGLETAHRELSLDSAWGSGVGGRPRPCPGQWPMTTAGNR